jgi:hypothetical protein
MKRARRPPPEHFRVWHSDLGAATAPHIGHPTPSASRRSVVDVTPRRAQPPPPPLRAPGWRLGPLGDRPHCRGAPPALHTLASCRAAWSGAAAERSGGNEAGWWASRRSRFIADSSVLALNSRLTQSYSSPTKSWCSQHVWQNAPLACQARFPF